MARKTPAIASADQLIQLRDGRTMLVADALARLEQTIGRAPGFEPDYEPTRKLKDGTIVKDEYNFCIGERLLPDGSMFRWEIRPDGYINLHVNLRFHQHKPIPGYGGKRERWAGYATYYRSADFVADLKWAYEWSAKAEAVAAKAKAKA